MSKFYNELKGSEIARKAVRVSAIIILIMVWILIDKGNIYGQSLSVGDDITQVKGETTPAPSFRERGDDDIPQFESGEGNNFTVRPNPVVGDLVFDFEFTVKTGIPYTVMDPLGRLAGQGHFEPGISTQSIDLSQLQAGLYIVALEIDGQAEVRKILKK